MITHTLVSGFLAKNKTVHAPTTELTGLGSCWLFSLPKTEDIEERKHYSTMEEIKRKTETEAKSAFQKCFEDLKKIAGINVLFLRDIRVNFGGDKIVIDK